MRIRTTLRSLTTDLHYPAPYIVYSRPVIIYWLNKPLRAVIPSPFQTDLLSPIEMASSLVCRVFLRGTFITSLNFERSWGGWGHVLTHHPFPDCLMRQNRFLLLVCGCYCCRKISAWPSQVTRDEHCTRLTEKRFSFFKKNNQTFRLTQSSLW